MSLEIAKKARQVKNEVTELLDEMFATIQRLESEKSTLVGENKYLVDIAKNYQSVKKPCCPKCNSEKIISTDNEPLEHNRADNVDNELYVFLKCTECSNEFKGVFNLTLK